MLKESEEWTVRHEKHKTFLDEKKNFLPILITFDTDSDDFQNQKFSSKQHLGTEFQKVFLKLNQH